MLAVHGSSKMVVFTGLGLRRDLFIKRNGEAGVSNWKNQSSLSLPNATDAFSFLRRRICFQTLNEGKDSR